MSTSRIQLRQTLNKHKALAKCLLNVCWSNILEGDIILRQGRLLLERKENLTSAQSHNFNFSPWVIWLNLTHNMSSSIFSLTMYQVVKYHGTPSNRLTSYRFPSNRPISNRLTRNGLTINRLHSNRLTSDSRCFQTWP